jgi:hypothetical protein
MLQGHFLLSIMSGLHLMGRPMLITLLFSCTLVDFTANALFYSGTSSVSIRMPCAFVAAVVVSYVWCVQCC